MFEKARYIQNSFNITFPRRIDIRRKANDFEDTLRGSLEGHYSQPQVIPVPDELDPEIPRLIFGSKHGFSQIVITQANLALNVVYSPDWQMDISRGRHYLLERVPILFKLLDILDGVSPHFCGLITKVHLHSQEEDAAILSHLVKLFLKKIEVRKTYDIEFKITAVFLERFFSNLTIRNYREWRFAEPQQGIARLSRNSLAIKGIEIDGDFNDRFAFNEDSKYLSNAGVASEIIHNGFGEMEKMIERVGGESP